MASIAARTAPRRLAALVAACSALATFAVEPPIVVKKRTRAGQEVLLRGFAEFDAQCRLKHVQSIAVARAPTGGSVEARPGDVVIGPNWVGAGQCAGTTLRGVQVFYVPAPGFVGTDRFALDVGYSVGRTVRADVEIDVR
jgi:hypothetical protein